MSEPKVIAFDFVCDEAPIFAKVSDYLLISGYKVVGITLGKCWIDFWKQLTTFSISVKRNYSEDELYLKLRRIEEKYGKLYPTSFLEMDRFLSKKTRVEQIKTLVGTFELVEEFFDQYSPDIYFCTGIAYLYNLVTYCVCKDRGIPHIALYSTRGSEPRFTYSRGIEGKWDRVFEEYQQENSDICLEEDITALNEFRQKSLKPHYMKYDRQKVSLNTTQLREFYQRVKYYYLDGWGKVENADYITQSPLFYAKRDMIKIIRANIIQLCKKSVFDNYDSTHDNYYLFPLHLQPEASTLIHAKWYVNQLNTIKNISMCLPCGTVLYVKEHISALGRNPVGFYKDIKSLHNVKLLSPWEPTKNLIIKSQGVIVLTSTMGWESLLLSKPTFVLGDVFYNVLSPRINTFDDLANTLRQPYNVVPDKNLARMIRAIRVNSYSGIFDVAKMDTREKVLDETNITCVLNALHEIIKIETTMGNK